LTCPFLSLFYRKQDQTPWQRISEGLPEAKGMIVPVLATNRSEPRVFYALTNKALYRSPDGGQHWEQMNIRGRENIKVNTSKRFW
jgi:hypothetical protein